MTTPTHLRLLTALVLACASNAAAAQEGKKPDHVSYVNKRGNVVSVSGRLTQNSLDGVIVEVDGSKKELAAFSVQRITYGETPEAFRDGLAYSERRDYANAAASFRLAASDPIARPPVQATARQRAARAELLHGAKDSTAFARAREEAERFLLDFPSNRGVPEVRLLEARAAYLSGDPAGAAESYRSLYKEFESSTTGYPADVCFRAGINAADAFLAAGNVDQGRELFSAVEASVPRVLSALDEDDVTRPRLASVAAQARLGDGFCQLASGSTGAAKTFFEGQVRDAKKNPALLHGARLGLAEALFKEGSLREAQIQFAQVSALDYTDRDRVARAMVGLAECVLQLNDKDARSQAQIWVGTVQERYGDTPAVSKAQELAKLL